MDNEEITKAIEEELSQTPYACDSLTKLSGGTANFVYRGILCQPLHDGTKTVVVKHTKDYVASNKDFKLSAERCLTEECSLRALDELTSVSVMSNEGSEGQKSQISVKTPRLFSFNPLTNTQVMEDLPDALDLKTFMSTLGVSETISQAWAFSVGRALGTWLSTFHSWASDPVQAKVAAQFSKNQLMQDLKFTINYDNLINTISKYPDLLEESRPVFERVRDMAAAEVGQTEGAGFGPIHGDFWSGNVLLPKTALNNPCPTTPVFITDWEMAQCGNRALDLGQMMAELYMLKHFRGSDAALWVIQGFAEGYQNIDSVLAFRAIIHVGVHLVFWGSTVPGWGTKEQVHDVVRVGRDLVTRAWAQDKTWLEGAVWKCLFKA